MAIQWNPGPLHSKKKISFPPSRNVFALVVPSVGVNEYEHNTTQAQ